MSNNLLQNTTENTQEIQKPIMSAYQVNTSAFQAVMEREFNAYLKNMKNLGLLTVSIKACKEAIATGTAVEKTKKASGRPKKAPARKVSDGDIIEGMVAKADAKPKKARKPKMTEEEKAAKKLLKEQEKAAKKAEKLRLKEEAKAAKKLAAEEAKAAKKLLKEQEKAAKKAEKEALKEKLKAEKAEAKRLEKEQKALEKAKIKAEKLAAKEQEKAKKKAAKAELKAKKKAQKKLQEEQAKAQALALMTAAIEEVESTDVAITNAEGEVIGSKVESFNLPEEKQPEEKQPEAELVEEEEEIADGYEAFTHDSRPNEKLVIDPATQNVFKVEEDGYEHIGQLDTDGALIECEESSDEEDEEAFPEM